MAMNEPDTHPSPSTWPFTGRSGTLEVLARVLRSGHRRGVLLEGPAGVGKTRLADAFLEAGDDLGVVARVRCVASPASQHVPFAALANLLPDDITASTGYDPLRVLAAVRERFAGQRVVMMVDDIVTLDEASLTLCSQLMACGELFVIGTRRDDQPVPVALDALVRSFDMARLDVQPLDDAAVAAAAHAVLGTPLDHVSLRRLVERSGGNPLYLRELLLQALAGGTVSTSPVGTAHVDLGSTVAPRLIELVTDRLAEVPADLIDALHMIAVAEPLLADDLERAGLHDHAARLERFGWLRVDQRGEDLEVRVAHPLHREVLRAAMGVLEQRRHTARAAELVRGRTEPRADDALRIALWELEAGLRPERQVLIDGARRARAAADLQSTMRLARAAHDVQPGPDSQWLLVEALFMAGRFAEAELLAAEPVGDDIDLTMLVSLMMLRMDNALWGLGSADRAEAVVEAYRPRFEALGIDFLLAYARAFIAANDGRSAEAEALLGREPSDPMLFILSSLASINTASQRGRFADVQRLCTRALEILAGLPEPRGSVDARFYVLSQALAMTASGRAGDALLVCRQTYAGVVDDRATFLRCLLGVVGGLAALRVGALGEAEDWFAETHTALQAVPFPTAERLVLAGLARVAAERGDAEGATAALQRLDDGRVELRWMQATVECSRAWAMYAAGRHGEARSVARAAAEWATAADEPVDALQSLVECCRLGDAEWAAGHLDALPSMHEVEGPLAAAQRDYVQTMAGRRAGALLDAAAALGEAAAPVVAAEAALAAASLFERSGNPRQAAAARARAAEWRAHSPDSDTPGLRAAATVEVSPLTPREQEIAELAAQGLTSKAIGERLYVSSRTVENHLQRVYTKLGVSTRDELTTRLLNLESN
jgi:DNA-binding CsgD family transcriptional regulator